MRSAMRPQAGEVIAAAKGVMPSRTPAQERTEAGLDTPRLGSIKARMGGAIEKAIPITN